MKAIWNAEIQKEKNHTLAFTYQYYAEKCDRLELTAASLYRLIIDGVFVGYGPARAAHGYSRVDQYDLSRYAGKKIHITVEVFASNINTYYVVDELPFFAAELYRGEQILAEAPDFQAYLLTDRLQKVQRFSFQRSFTEVYDMKCCRSAFYRGEAYWFPPIDTEQVPCNQLLERGVSYPKLNTVIPQKVVECGKLEIDPTLPKWTDRSWTNISDQLKGYSIEELDICISHVVSAFVYQKTGQNAEQLQDGMYQIYDFGKTITGFFQMHLDVKKAAVIYVIFDEVIDLQQTGSRINPFRNDCCNAIQYHLQPGIYDLTTFEANSARFAALAVMEGTIVPVRFSMIAYENPDVMAFSYQTGDVELDAVIEAAKNTLAQNAVDVLTDCPSRERAGWLCDSYFSGRTERLMTGKNLVEHNFLENYFMSPQSPFLPQGMLPMCYPADHNDGVYIPNWPMWIILELQNYVERTGDLRMKELAKPRIYDLIRFFSAYLNEDGLLENLENWVFVEWSKCNDPDYLCGVNYPTNMLYAAALEAAGGLYEDTALTEQASAMKQIICDQSYDGAFFEDNRIRVDGILCATGHVTETCQYYAFYFGVASKTEYTELYHRMATEFGPARDSEKIYPEIAPSNAFVGNYLRLEMLLRDQEYQQVLQECKDFFCKMAQLTGTLWEHSSITNSLNHGFASIAANYILECLNYRQTS